MLELSLELRKDGLGPKLRPGAVTLLYEQRERQLTRAPAQHLCCPADRQQPNNPPMMQGLNGSARTLRLL